MIIGKGSSGPLVLKLQQALKALDFDPGDLDSDFGESTQRALKDFQRARGLPADGIAGPQVFSVLERCRQEAASAEGTSGQTSAPGGAGHAGAGGGSGAAENIVPEAAAGAPSVRTKVFISYSHRDLRWLEEFQKYLVPLEEDGLVVRWDDTLIEAGQDWQAEIDAALATAGAAVLLVSSNFMASRYVRNYELPYLLGARDKIAIIPVIINPCDLGILAGVQAVNSPDRTLVDMTKPNQGRLWLKTVGLIRAALAAK